MTRQAKAARSWADPGFEADWPTPVPEWRAEWPGGSGTAHAAGETAGIRPASARGEQNANFANAIKKRAEDGKVRFFRCYKKGAREQKVE